MKLQLIQWNIKINSNVDKIIEYLNLKIQESAIINLQEVSMNNYQKIYESLKIDSLYSLNFRKPGKYEGKNRYMGVMTLVNVGEIVTSQLINSSIFPERTLYSAIDIGGILISNLNFHSLTGVDYKKAKSSNFASIASFLSGNNVDIISCDANEPNIDSFNDDEIECFDNRDKGKMANLLFGKEKIHSLVDSYKQYCRSKNEKIETGYSHITGGKKKRYDFIYCKKEWKILCSESNYQESIKYTSDHALIETFVEIENG